MNSSTPKVLLIARTIWCVVSAICLFPASSAGNQTQCDDLSPNSLRTCTSFSERILRQCVDAKNLECWALPVDGGPGLRGVRSLQELNVSPQVPLGESASLDRLRHLAIGRLDTVDGFFATASLIDAEHLLTVRHASIRRTGRFTLAQIAPSSLQTGAAPLPLSFALECDPDPRDRRQCLPVVSSRVSGDGLIDHLDYAIYRLAKATALEGFAKGIPGQYGFRSIKTSGTSGVPPTVNSSVYSVGYSTNPFYPSGPLFSGQGWVRWVDRSGEHSALLHNLQVAKGMSGAPLFTSEGTCVAIQSRALWPDISPDSKEWGSDVLFGETLKDYFQKVYSKEADGWTLKNAFAVPNQAVLISHILKDAASQGFKFLE